MWLDEEKKATTHVRNAVAQPCNEHRQSTKGRLQKKIKRVKLQHEVDDVIS
jgi:hypothetical protein